jgi:hypothetical protein
VIGLDHEILEKGGFKKGCYGRKTISLAADVSNRTMRSILIAAYGHRSVCFAPQVKAMTVCPWPAADNMINVGAES